jgi:hypothetical protein
MQIVCPRKKRGRRECRVKASPMARVQQKSTRQNHRLSRSSGIPCAAVLTLIRVLPGAPGFLATMPCATRKRRRKVDTSVGVSGPHDFTSASSTIVVAPSASTAPRKLRLVTIGRNAPLHRKQDARKYRSDLPDKASLCARDKVTRRAICACRGCER